MDVTGAAKTLLQTSAVQKEMKVSLQETQVSSEFSKRDSVTNKEAVPVSKDELLEQSEVVVSTSSIQKIKSSIIRRIELTSLLPLSLLRKNHQILKMHLV